MDRRDISDLDDVRLLVNTFYDKVREDKILAPVFNDRIGKEWPRHLEKMCRFWQTILLGEHTYSGAPFQRHTNLPVEHVHFQKWLELFHSSVDVLFAGEKAEEAKRRGSKIAEMFEMKIKHPDRL
jgi:hemoglobin